MNVVAPWLLLMGFLAWKYGIQAGQLPAPYRFLGGTGLMAFAAIVAEANSTIGTLLAWGFLLGALVYTAKQPTAQVTAQAPGPQPS